MAPRRAAGAGGLSMPPLPEEFLAAWRERQPLAAFATAGPDGRPNVIWALCLHLDEAAARAVVADNAMERTRANIDAGSAGALVVLAPPRRAWQLYGALAYHAAGPVFEAMKRGWLDASFPGRGAVEMTIAELRCGAETRWRRAP